MSEKFSEFISCIMTAISNCSLYSKEHPAVIDLSVELSSKAVSILDELYVNDTLSLTIIGRNLMLNDALSTEQGVHMTNFKKRLRTKGIEKIIIKKGVSPEELQRFISDMSSTRKTPSCTPNITVGTLQVRFISAEADSLDEKISILRDAFQGLSKFKILDMAGLEDIVLSFISALKSEANILRILSPLKSFDEYTYVHAMNVSILTMFQAEVLGMNDEGLYNAGLSGLLHDVGKMFVSKEIIEKHTGLDEMEWVEMKKHPIYGATYLSTQQETPKLAVITAFEHHMRFDGSGYPDTKRRGKRQHIISQLVAISDFFDAMRTERPYRKALEVQTIVGLIKEAAGRDFNPLLAANFLDALKRIGVFYY